MKSFFKKYGLIIPPLLFTGVYGYAILCGRGLKAIDSVILGLMCATVITAVISRAKENKTSAVLTIVLAIACVVICCPALRVSRVWDTPSFLVQTAVMLILALNMIPAFSSKEEKAIKEPAAKAENQQVADMQAQLAQMRSEMERMKAGTATQETPVAPTPAPVEVKAEPVAAPDPIPMKTTYPEQQVASAMPIEKAKATESVQKEEKAPFSFNRKWIVVAIVSLLFILFSTRASAFVSFDAYLIKCLAVAAVACIAMKKRGIGIVLAIAYAVLNTIGFFDTLQYVSFRSSMLDSGIKALLYFKTLGSMLAVVPILFFAFSPRRGKGLLKLLCGISIGVLVAEIAINLLGLGTLASLFPCVALNYFFCTAAAFAIGASANVEKKKTTNSIHSLFANEEKVENLGPKSKMVAVLLSFFLGGVGAHRYYLGYKKRGILMSIGCGCLVLGSILLGIGSASAMVGAVYGKSSGGAVVLTILSIPLTLAGSAVGIMALIDFIQILMGKLLPADGNPYQDSVPAQAPVNNTANNMEALEKLAKLHEQGILTDEEFQQKKTELLSKM